MWGWQILAVLQRVAEEGGSWEKGVKYPPKRAQVHLASLRNASDPGWGILIDGIYLLGAHLAMYHVSEAGRYCVFNLQWADIRQLEWTRGNWWGQLRWPGINIWEYFLKNFRHTEIIYVTEMTLFYSLIMPVPLLSKLYLFQI